MTYDEALAFWYGRIDYERRQPRPGDLKLDRMRALLRRLGDPHRRLRCIHIAGTKGKGSTSAILAAILRAAGLRTGLFTSPHLSDVSERVQVDGVPISRDEIAVRMSEVALAVDAMDAEGDPARSPTFFEVITALGFLHFDCRRVDIAVLEVGLGGRFDSTNVCDPLVSIVTNVSFDHMAMLGNTLAEIAFQKAGIIKRGVPVVTTADNPEVLGVIERVAAEHDTGIRAAGRDFRWTRFTGKPYEAGTVNVATGRRDYGVMAFGLFGKHQGANAAGAIAATEILCNAGLAISDAAVAAGLRDVVWPARLELVGRSPTVVLDCAHNVASAAALAETLQASFPIRGRRHLIFAASNDKQIAEILAVLAPHFDCFHLTRYLSNPRSADPSGVADVLRGLGKTDIRIHSNPNKAWQAVRAEVGPEDGIVIAGSVFLAGELRPIAARLFMSCSPSPLRRGG
ncbi:MAG TPA: folylpolyglutamate synthase/dihydrofolate synthase family protein [Gemmataceae bacterium]|jgi:dihydrofolate synthase/folylpolyglutamate synthase|nr:folylpolyglutamate synthase/dihydrofolate synthase family protein [Gemmataceae bacterium]